MKILFDQNISPKITKYLASSFLESKQVRHLGLENASDIDIFEFAKNNGFAIATFDSDYVDINTFRGVPPKVIWLRTGNLTTRAIVELFKSNSTAIELFLMSTTDEILELNGN